MKHNLFSLLGI